MILNSLYRNYFVIDFCPELVHNGLELVGNSSKGSTNTFGTYPNKTFWFQNNSLTNTAHPIKVDMSEVWTQHHLKKSTSYGSSSRSPKGKMTMHWSSFYKQGDKGGLSLNLNQNLQDFQSKAGGRSEGFALMGYVCPGCVEDGAWLLWGKSSVAVAAFLARSFLDIV